MGFSFQDDVASAQITMYTGKHDPYFWLEDPGLSLATLLKAHPEVVLGKYVVVTAFDSGPFCPSDEEFRQGWQSYGALAFSPVIRSITELPYDNYDEWYIFDQPPRPESLEVFVNYVHFSLQDAEEGLPAPPVEAAWDLTTTESEGYTLRDLQQRFWIQLGRIAPESYVAEGEKLICVTRDYPLYKELIEWGDTQSQRT